MVKPKSFVKVFSGVVRRGPSPFRETENDHGTLLGGVDFVKELSTLDKRRHYYAELHNGEVKQAADIPGRFSLLFDPLYRSDSNQRLIVAVGDAETADQLEVDGEINLLALINSRPNRFLTLIVASAETDVNLSELPKPHGAFYTD